MRKRQSNKIRVKCLRIFIGLLCFNAIGWAEEPQKESLSKADFFNTELLEEISTTTLENRQPLKYNIKVQTTEKTPGQPFSGGTNKGSMLYQIKLESPLQKQETQRPQSPPSEEISAPSAVDAAPHAPQAPTHGVSQPTLPPTSASPSPVATSIMTDESFELYPRESHLIILPEDPIQIFLADPKIAEIQQTNPSTVHIQALSPGHTEIVVTGKRSRNLYRYRVKVQPDFRELRDFIARNYQNSNVLIKPLPNGILLEGAVTSSKAAEDIKTLAERFFPEKGAVVNRLQVKSNSQINLRVKIAEVNRTVVNQLGINWNTVSNYGNFRFGMLNGRLPIDSTTSGFNSPSELIDPIKSIGGRFTDSRNDIAGLLDMLAAENLATVLAEPNLITSSGEEASFLVGGEFPYPVAQGIGTTQTVSFQFKKYGISLSFLPVVMGNTITLRVRPEVSDLDQTRTIRDQNGNNIPSIRTRRAESTIEMGNGQSMVMAGLLSDQTSSNINAFPGLGDVPILGALFRSNAFKNEKTELVIVVTPYFVEPTDNPTEVALPTDGLKYANFFDMVWRRRINEPRGDGINDPVSSLKGETGFYY